MTILAIETATDVCSVALAVDGALVDQRNLRRPRVHSEQLASMISACVQTAGMKMKDLDVVAVSAGPGSYTGLRIGTSTAKGIVFGTNARLVAVSTLEAMAYPFMPDRSGPVIAVLPSRRREYYVAAFERTESGTLARKHPESIVSVDDLAPALRDSGITGGLFVLQNPPSGARDKVPVRDAEPPEAYGSYLFESLVKNRSMDGFHVAETAVSADNVMFCSISRIEKQLFEDASDFEPYYLRAFEAKKPGRSVFDRLLF